MKEDQPQRVPPSGDASPTWDAQAIGQALNREPEPAADVAFGNGVRYRLGEAQPLELELFPHQGVVRLTGGDLQLSLFRQDHGPHVVGEGLVFELAPTPPGRSLSVSRQGDVTLFLTSPDGSVPSDEHRPPFLRPQDEAFDPKATSSPLSSERPLPDDPVPQETPSNDPSPAETPEAPDPERIPRMTGRLGGNPRFHENRKGQLVAEFDLAVKDPDDPTKTTWHRIVVFGARAQALRDTLRKGDQVDIIGGYRHVREFTGRDGTKKRKEEVYPTVVKPR